MIEAQNIEHARASGRKATRGGAENVHEVEDGKILLSIPVTGHCPSGRAKSLRVSSVADASFRGETVMCVGVSSKVESPNISGSVRKMTDKPISSEDAAQLFAARMSVEAFRGSVQVISAMLQQGPSGRSPDRLLDSLHQWFLRLDASNQEQVNALVVETARTAVFECLSVLDGVIGGYAIPDLISDFALYLQTYADEEAWLDNRPRDTVRINHLNRTGPDLHDLFMELSEPTS